MAAATQWLSGAACPARADPSGGWAAGCRPLPGRGLVCRRLFNRISVNLRNPLNPLASAVPPLAERTPGA
jgi:hypothetical protein